MNKLTEIKVYPADDGSFILQVSSVDPEGKGKVETNTAVNREALIIRFTQLINGETA